MKETKFKTLVYRDFYVDEIRLEYGIYISKVPFIHHKDTTIEDIILKWGSADGFIENIRHCQLVDIEILEQSKSIGGFGYKAGYTVNPQKSVFKLIKGEINTIPSGYEIFVYDNESYAAPEGMFSDYNDFKSKLFTNMNKLQKDKSLPIERFDAEEWLGTKKDIWNHPRITDRNEKESYEVADLMAEFANQFKL